MKRYEFVEIDVLSGYIADRRDGLIVALVATKRPDLQLNGLKELIEKANKYDKEREEECLNR